MKILSPWSEAIVGGLSGLAVVLAYQFFSGLSPSLSTADVATFSGALVGVAGAVLGGMFLEDRRRRLTRAEELALIRSAIDKIREGAWKIAVQPLESFTVGDKAGLFETAFRQIDDGKSILAFAQERSDIAIKGVALFSELLTLHASLDEARAVFDSERNILGNNQLTHAVMDIMRNQLRDDATRIEYQARNAIQTIDSGKG